MKKYLRLLPLLLICLALVACTGKTLVKEEAGMEGQKSAEEETVVVPEEGVEEGALGAAEEAGATSMGAEEGAAIPAGLKSVHFDFDKYTIREMDKEALNDNAIWLKAHPDNKILIEGHADERGENEYNLALGEKRAMSVMNYLKGRGINKKRLSVISYGEEKPLDPGHDEDAWAKNRRVEFKQTR